MSLRTNIVSKFGWSWGRYARDVACNGAASGPAHALRLKRQVLLSASNLTVAIPHASLRYLRQS